MQLTAHTRPATDRKQRGAALGTVAPPTGATVGQSYLACVGNRDLCSADASTLRSRIGRSWRRVGHPEQHIRRGLKDHLPCPRSGGSSQLSVPAQTRREHHTRGVNPCLGPRTTARSAGEHDGSRRRRAIVAQPRVAVVKEGAVLSDFSYTCCTSPKTREPRAAGKSASRPGYSCRRRSRWVPRSGSRWARGRGPGGGKAADHQVDLTARETLPVAGAGEWPGEQRCGHDQVLGTQVCAQFPCALPTLDQSAQHGANLSWRSRVAGVRIAARRGAATRSARGRAAWRGRTRERLPGPIPDTRPPLVRCRSRGRTSGTPARRAGPRGWEVAVDRPDPHARVLGDLGDRDLLPVPADELGGRVKHPFAIAKCVLARLTGGGMRHLATSLR